MEYTVKSGNPEKQRIGCVVIPIFASRKLSSSAKIIDRASNGFISNLVRRGEIEGDLGNMLLLHNVENTLCDRILLVGCGKEKDISVKTFYKINSHMVKRLQASGATEIASYLTEVPVKRKDLNWKIQHSIEAISEYLYKFNQLKSKTEETRRPLRKFIFSVNGRGQLMQGEQAVRQGMAISTGIHLAKDLGNLPGNICTPDYLAKQALKLDTQHSNIKTSVLEEKDMEKLGMGSLLSVSKGSRQAGKLITIKYSAGNKKQAPIVFVGKGVTFDSGGISLKPGAGMDEMKYDMCGAASVIGVLSACAELQLPINLVGIIPTVENMPDGIASRPGDIVTSMSGQTIEILNTDAEGRLILCDALTYAEKFNPDVVIDIATLTGACVVALGAHPAGLLSNHNPLANDLLSAGQNSGDRCWQLPLWDDYQEQLKSNFADMANIGGKGAGTITAACFLARFTKKYHWAHLDIAGVAWKSGSQKGATGRPVGLLTQYVLDKMQATK
ncbi:Cytosol aminopeptidase PepA [hydrothermal vent metagenome]|uniref:leucyl aminopeptidase n=1 Tax=hydrothermal vent metagenome TaxID=652676 RepID=A0A3B0XEH2_9ZZZZ